VSATERARGGAARLIREPIRHPAALVVLALIWAALAWLRLNPAARDTVWAEDGRNFLGGAYADGPFTDLFTPYAGYLQFVPRVLAGVTSLLPVSWDAQVLTALSCLVAGGIALAIYCLTGTMGIRQSARLLIASITVLAPALWYEVLGNTANLHSLFLWLAPWLFLARCRTWRMSVLLGLLGFVAATTEIQVVFFLPLLLWRFDRRRLPVTIGAVLGVALQVVAFVTSPRAVPTFRIPLPVNLLDGFFFQGSMTAWVGSAKGAAVLVWLVGWLVAYLSFVPFIGAAVYLWRHKTPERSGRRALIFSLVAGAFVVWVAGYVINGSPFDYSRYGVHQLLNHAVLFRYGTVPSMFLLALLPLLLDQLVGTNPTRRARWRRRLIPVLSVVLVVIFAANFVGLGLSPRDRGPSWEHSLTSGHEQCLSKPSNTVVQIPTAPIFAPWRLAISCGRLESGG
jgi:hypothetical protein